MGKTDFLRKGLLPAAREDEAFAEWLRRRAARTP
jgi:hypothetical protein